MFEALHELKLTLLPVIGIKIILIPTLSEFTKTTSLLTSH